MVFHLQARTSLPWSHRSPPHRRERLPRPAAPLPPSPMGTNWQLKLELNYMYWINWKHKYCIVPFLDLTSLQVRVSTVGKHFGLGVALHVIFIKVWLWLIWWQTIFFYDVLGDGRSNCKGSIWWQEKHGITTAMIRTYTHVCVWVWFYGRCIMWIQHNMFSTK